MGEHPDLAGETGPSVPIRIERGENASGMSQGTWIYRGDMMVWGHVASEGPMPEGALGVIEAIFGPADSDSGSSASEQGEPT